MPHLIQENEERSHKKPPVPKDPERASQIKQKIAETPKNVKNQTNSEGPLDPNEWQETQGHTSETGDTPKMAGDSIEGE